MLFLCSRKRTLTHVKNGGKLYCQGHSKLIAVDAVFTADSFRKHVRHSNGSDELHEPAEQSNHPFSIAALILHSGGGGAALLTSQGQHGVTNNRRTHSQRQARVSNEPNEHVLGRPNPRPSGCEASGSAKLCRPLPNRDRNKS